MSNKETENLVLIVAEEKGGAWIRKDAGKIRRMLNDTYKGVQNAYRGVREHTSPVRWISEKVFSGFGEQMENLREVDEQIQNWTSDLDNCLNRAEDAKKEGRVLDVIFWLSQINNRLGLVAAKGNELRGIHEKDLAEFYSDSEHGVQDDYFTSGEGKIVQAGFVDSLGRKITNWKMQQMYRERLANQNRAINRLLSSASLLVNKVENRLAVMSKARSRGDIARYMAGISDISKFQSTFEQLFRTQFNEHFSQMVDVLKQREKQIAQEQVEQIPPTVDMPAEAVPPTLDMIPETKNEPTVDMPAGNAYFQSAPEPGLPATNPAGPYFEPESNGPASERAPEFIDLSPESDPSGGIVQGPIQEVSVNNQPQPYAPPQQAPKPKAKAKAKKKTQEEESPQTSRSAEMQSILLRKSHSDFYKELEKASKLGEPALLAGMLSKYSEMIDESDPDTSEELLTLAEVILNV